MYIYILYRVIYMNLLASNVYIVYIISEGVFLKVLDLTNPHSKS